MPRGRRNNQQQHEDMTLDEFAQILEDDNKISMVKYIVCKDFLKNMVWDLSKKAEIKHTCSICLEEIGCKHCFTLLSCGHAFDAACLMKWKNSCPLCKN
jgi:hypothetical protein